jgi:hypothetical protein
MSRFGIRPLGFESRIVELTGVHFHYAGFMAATLASLAVVTSAQRRRFPRLASTLGMLTVVGPPLIAIGFSAVSVLLVIGAIILVTGVIGIAGLTFVVVAREATGSTKVLLTVSSFAVLAPMVLAVSYSSGRAFGLPALSIDQMAATHGLVNGFLYMLPGLLGWRRVLEGGGEV